MEFVPLYTESVATAFSTRTTASVAFSNAVRDLRTAYPTYEQAHAMRATIVDAIRAGGGAEYQFHLEIKRAGLQRPENSVGTPNRKRYNAFARRVQRFLDILLDSAYGSRKRHDTDAIIDDMARLAVSGSSTPPRSPCASPVESEPEPEPKVESISPDAHWVSVDLPEETAPPSPMAVQPVAEADAHYPPPCEFAGRQVTAGSECPLCFYEYSAIRMPARGVNCVHIVCIPCIRQMIRTWRGGDPNARACPLCRADFVPRSRSIPMHLRAPKLLTVSIRYPERVVDEIARLLDAVRALEDPDVIIKY